MCLIDVKENGLMCSSRHGLKEWREGPSQGVTVTF